MGAAEDAPGVGVGRKQVGGVLSAAGDFFDAVDERNALARTLVLERIHAAAPSLFTAQAACTDSMIFT